MDYLRVIDSICESINFNEIDGESRLTYLLYIFSQLKTVNFTLPDLDSNVTKYVITKFSKKHINEHLDNIHETFVFMDIRFAAEAVLDKVKTEVKINYEKAEIKHEKVPQEKETYGEYNPESDVLDDEEGYMEPPPARQMVYDEEFLKSLGIKNE